jgi:Transcriptional activator of acetoin/glycerol metabolism
LKEEILKKLMKERHVNITQMAKILGIKRETLSRKLSLKQPFLLKEAFIIQRTFFPDIPIEKLFEYIKEKSKVL